MHGLSLWVPRTARNLAVSRQIAYAACIVGDQIGAGRTLQHPIARTGELGRADPVPNQRGRAIRGEL